MQDTDLAERQAEAKERLYEYFQVKKGAETFKWTFSNWSEAGRRNLKELPFKQMDVKYLDKVANGWGSVEERETWHCLVKEANPSDICISTNHMLMIAAIRDDATTFEIMASLPEVMAEFGRIERGEDES